MANRSTARTLIVTCGDCTDFDGFLSLILYSCVPNADTMFVSHYPAIFNPSVGGIPESFHGQPYESPEFGKGFQWTRSNIDTGIAVFRSKFLTFLRSVWPEVIPNKLFLVEGGTHDINAFARETYKEPEEVFKDVLKDCNGSGSVRPPGIDKDEDVFDRFPDIDEYDEVYVDMVGSVAFYESDTGMFKWMQKLLGSGKFKALHVMGGVYDNEIPGTLGAFRFKTNDGINRLSCATMNQLYAPAKTMRFLDDCKAHEIPITVISNNLISTVASYADYDTFKKEMQPILSRGTELFEKGFEVFYKNSKTLKVWDVVSSLSLITDLLPDLLPSRPKVSTSHLFVNPEYGITLVSKDADCVQAIKHYAAQLQEKVRLSPKLPRTMLDNYLAESKLLLDNLTNWQYKTYPVYTSEWTKDQVAHMIVALCVNLVTSCSYIRN